MDAAVDAAHSGFVGGVQKLSLPYTTIIRLERSAFGAVSAKFRTIFRRRRIIRGLLRVWGSVVLQN
jgi:hypothetical protein